MTMAASTSPGRSGPVKACFRGGAGALPLLLVLAAGCGPQLPTRPYLLGQRAAQPQDTLEFRAVAQDANGGNLAYLFDWGDGTAPAWSAELSAGDTFRQRHVYADTGRFTVTVRCRDEGRLESDPSEPLEVMVAFRGPGTPSVPQGPSRAHYDTLLSFSTSAGHVLGESVAVQFDWGDAPGEWTGFVPAGAPVADSHVYTRASSYAVRARARDRAGNLSPWSAAHDVEIVPLPLGPPTDICLTAVAGVQVKLHWTAGDSRGSVRYVIWFSVLGAAEFAPVGTVTGTSFTHDPLSSTGLYAISVRRDSEEVFAAETLSTMPVFTDTFLLRELNADSVNAFGWDTLTGEGRLGSMLDTGDAGFMDFYLTDLTPGHNGPSYYLASPAFGPEDPGGAVPDGPWRGTRLMGILGNLQDPVPEYDSMFYQRVVDASSVRSHIAAHTPEGFYALVSTFGPNPTLGTLRAVAWFQRVRGLRLMQHTDPE
jgi:hypothetical protein